MKETLPQAPHKPRRLLPKLLLALAAVLAALPPQTVRTSTASSSPGSGDWRGWIWGSWSGSSPPGSGA